MPLTPPLLRWDGFVTTFLALPRFFARFGLHEPTDRLQTPYAFARDRLGSSLFEILNSDKNLLREFMLSMSAMETWSPARNPYDFGWVAQHAAADVDGERVLLVDVGGGRGHALARILRENPGIVKSRCVLEDLKETVGEVEKEGREELEGVRLMAVNFHAAQPVKRML